MWPFTKRQSDQQWKQDIQPLSDAACAAMRELDQALDEESVEKEYLAIQTIATTLPHVLKQVKRVPRPTSNGARQAEKQLRSALMKYIDAAKQGNIFFKDMSGGPGQRARQETGLPQRAAAGRLVFSQTMFKTLAESGQTYMKRCSVFFGREIS